MFDSIEEMFVSLRGYNDHSRALVTLATGIGTILLGFYSLKFLFGSVKGFRLYVWSQYFSRVDFKERYGKWAVISGATDGIGLEMAKELARRGHSLVIIGRNTKKLADSKAALEQESNVGEVVTVQIDLSDPSLDNYERIRDQIDAENRDIGILINNAGIAPTTFGRYNDHELELVHDIMNVNVLGTLSLTHMIMPSMLRRGKGLVLNVSSTIGSMTGAYWCAYGPSKTFVNSFSRLIQVEYSGGPIDIINLTPGLVHTKIITDTGAVKKPSVLCPLPDYYAKSALNAVSTRINSFAGTAVHELTLKAIVMAESLGLTHFWVKMIFKLTGVRIVPVAKSPRLIDANSRRTTTF